VSSLRCVRDVSTIVFFFFSSRRRHTRLVSDWSSDVCSSDLTAAKADFAQFRDAGYDAYLVRPVRPQSLLTHMGVSTVEGGATSEIGRASCREKCRCGGAPEPLKEKEKNEEARLLKHAT